MEKIMFDTNVFDEILEGNLDLKLIKDSIKVDYEYFITHIQIEELSNIPDSKKEKRRILAIFLNDIRPRLIPTESTVLGHSRFGLAKLGNADFYKLILNQNKDNVKDALIGETAIKQEITLITEDEELKSKVENLGGTVLKVKELQNKIVKDLEGKK